MRPSAFFRYGCILATIAATAASAPAAQDAQTGGDANLKPMHSFKVRLTDSTPKGSTSRVITYVAPDKLRIEIVGSPMVVVAIAKNVWLRGDNGKWQKASYASGVDPLSDVRATFNLATELNGPGVHFKGTQNLDGSVVKVFDIDPPSKDRNYAGRTTRFWIGATDGYPHKIEQRKGAYKFTADYSAWNQPLTVSAR